LGTSWVPKTVRDFLGVAIFPCAISCQARKSLSPMPPKGILGHGR
jgi:hypothetical protein